MARSSEQMQYQSQVQSKQLGITPEEYEKRKSLMHSDHYTKMMYDASKGNAIPKTTQDALASGATMEGLLGVDYSFLDRGGLGAPAEGMQHGVDQGFRQKDAGGPGYGDDTRAGIMGSETDGETVQFTAPTPGIAPGAPQDKSYTTSGVAPGFVPPTIQSGGLQFGTDVPATSGTATAAPGMAFAGLAKQGAATPEPVQPTQPGKQARPRNPFNIGQPGVPFGG